MLICHFGESTTTLIRSVSLIVILKTKHLKPLQTEMVFAVALTAQALSFVLHYSWLGQISAITDPASTQHLRQRSAPPASHQAVITKPVIPNIQ